MSEHFFFFNFLTRTILFFSIKNTFYNDIDRKHVDIVRPPHTTIGCDFAGTVQDVGRRVAADRQRWKKGDRIAGFTHGGNEVQPEDGCAAEYCVVKAGLCMKVRTWIFRCFSRTL